MLKFALALVITLLNNTMLLYKRKKKMISIVCEEQKWKKLEKFPLFFVFFYCQKFFFSLSVRDTYFRLPHAWRLICVLSNGCFELNIHCSLSMCAWHITISFGLLFPRLRRVQKRFFHDAVKIGTFFAAPRINEFRVNQVIWRWISVATTPRTHSFRFCFFFFVGRVKGDETQITFNLNAKFSKPHNSLATFDDFLP